MMRWTVHFFAIYFFLLSLAPNFQGIQFFKIASLIEHYQSHQSSSQQFDSFISFLIEHYDGDHLPGENEQDLPFKSTFATVSVLIIQQGQLFTSVDYIGLPSAPKKHLFPDFPGFPKNTSCSIWNPPKLT
jgi:hypothetical protein